MILDKIVLTEEELQLRFKYALPHQMEALYEALGLPKQYIEDEMFVYKLMHFRLLERINPAYLKFVPKEYFPKIKQPIVSQEENDALSEIFEGYTRDDK